MQGDKPLDAMKFIRGLNKAGIKYLLIGRRALVFHGAPVQTVDYDFFISHEKENLRLFLNICDRLDMEVIPFGADDPFKSYKLSVYSGGEKIDVFRAKGYSLKSGGTVDFGEMWETREVIHLDDNTAINLPSLECLEKTKRIRLSAKDVEDIKYIRELILRRDWRTEA